MEECNKLKNIYLTSCNLTSKSLSYLSHDIKTKADANCMKSIELIKSFNCSNSNIDSSDFKHPQKITYFD